MSASDSLHLSGVNVVSVTTSISGFRVWRVWRNSASLDDRPKAFVTKSLNIVGWLLGIVHARRSLEGTRRFNSVLELTKFGLQSEGICEQER